MNYGIETSRLSFVEQRDGVAGAVDFARCTLRIYRTAVLCSRRRGFTKPHHASLPAYRPGFIASYVGLKRYVSDHGGAA